MRWSCRPIFLLLIILNVLVKCEENTTVQSYYQILGVEKDSTSEDIRKAYRVLALKYHPDNNPDSDAAAKFIEVSEAYDVLSDTEKKKEYDEGPKRVVHATSKEDWAEEVFMKFFKEGKKPTRPPKSSSKAERKKIPIIFEGNPDIIQIDGDDFQYLSNRLSVDDEAWLVIIYHSAKNYYCKKFEKEAESVLKELHTFLTVAAITCDRDPEMCKQYSATNRDPLAAVLISPGRHISVKKFPQNPFRFGDLKKFALANIPSVVVPVKTFMLDKFLKNPADKIKVLLFSEDRNPPQNFNLVGKMFSENMVFGYVWKTQKDLFEKFKVTEMPTIIVFPTKARQKYFNNTDNQIHTFDRLVELLNNVMQNDVEPPPELQPIEIKDWTTFLQWMEENYFNKGDRTILEIYLFGSIWFVFQILYLLFSSISSKLSIAS